MREVPGSAPRQGRWNRTVRWLGAVTLVLGSFTALTTERVEAASSYSSIPIASWMLNGEGRAIVKVGNVVYVGGSFNRATSPDGLQSAGRANLAAFDATTGALVAGFRADTNGRVDELLTDGTSLFVSGNFTIIGGVARSRIAALDPTTGAVRVGFRADTNNTVFSMSLRGTDLYVAGSFSTVNGVTRRGVAKLSSSTGAVDAAFAPDVTGTVKAVAAAGGSKLYIGGPYSLVNGVTATDITTLDANTGAISGPALTGITGYVDDLLVTPDGRSLIAGHSGVPGIGNRTAVYDTSTGSRRWRQIVEGDVQGVHVIGNRVISGFHDGSNGDSASRLASYDLATGTEDLTFRPSFDRFMGAREVHGDNTAVVVAGDFSVISGVRVEGFAIFPAAAPTPFAASVWGSQSWRFLDNGSDQGTAWRLPGFSDATWRTGVGEFGYGDGGEPTKVSFGPSAANKYLATYFRTTFNATAVPASAAIYMRVDDGAVVYVNGVEAVRDNLSAGAISSSTLAVARDGEAETHSRYFPIDPALIRPGQNTLAVEVHQTSPTSDDLSFFATMVAYGSSSAPPPPTTSTTVPATTVPATTAPPSTPPTTTPPTPTPPTTTPPPTTTATTSTTTTTTTTPTTTTTTTPTGLAVSLTASAPWSYLDDGSNQGTAWATPEFDDSAWKVGVGEFGYGDGDERTLIGFGPSSTSKYTTTYFRTRFVATATLRELTLTLRVDDGAVVFVNGVEAARVNMPSGPIDHRTLAPEAISEGGERLDRNVIIDPTLVATGTNVIAVEVHQNTRGSSDISFLASLTGRS